MKKLISIIIPTFNNPQFLNPCVQSIVNTGILREFSELILVNNGNQPLEKEFGHLENVRIVNAHKNLGWEGGLKTGLEISDAPFVCFQNDDTFIPPAMRTFYHNLLIPFQDKNVAVSGPTTTCAAGLQSIYHPGTPFGYYDTRWLIFFCSMIRREHLDKVGGVDTSLSGGDDFDLCIRLRKAGYKLRICPDAFLIHHGFKTGERVRGTPDQDGGWNSIQFHDAVNMGLIQKHGFKEFFTTIAYQGIVPDDQSSSDPEMDIIKSLVQGKNVLELGCGSRKIVPDSIGVDIIENGKQARDYDKRVSVADVQCDVTDPLPFERDQFETVIASHIIEHCVDTVGTLMNWKKVLKPGGMLIISTPNELITNGIPLNPEHCHTFTQESLRSLLELVGFKQTFSRDSGNGVSFVSGFEKLGVPIQSESLMTGAVSVA